MFSYRPVGLAAIVEYILNATERFENFCGV
jgi:hypothetical protein